MKKTIAMILCAALTLTACGGGASTGDTKAASDGKQKLVLSTYGLSEDISAEEVYAPFEQGLTVKLLQRQAGPMTVIPSWLLTVNPALM